ncbi:DUF5130 family protein [Pseudonocardia eucalypti]|uniref:DUF5130 family protein n=1 Tax=Pseudonocardia eucalypti TaxID=648755 RepID=A0ABP9RE54_9PSEU|nr:hypothetical protein [Pseudonocardia eucalypti]
MATGELTSPEAEAPEQHHVEPSHDGHLVPRAQEEEELPYGAVRTASGRISAAEEYRSDQVAAVPFSSSQLNRLDDTLTLVSKHTKLRFSIYLGDLLPEPRAAAEKLHDQLGAAGADSVLIAVDPGRKKLEIVTGPAAKVRLSDRVCDLAAINMVASFKEGDLFGGLLTGLRMLSDQTG